MNKELQEPGISLGRLEGFVSFDPSSPLVHCKSQAAPSQMDSDGIIQKIDKAVTDNVIRTANRIAVGLVKDGVPPEEVMPPASILQRALELLLEDTEEKTTL